MSSGARGTTAKALLALGVLALALHAHVVAGESLVAWDLTASQALFARPGVARGWNLTLQDTVVWVWPYLRRDALEGGATWSSLSLLGHPANVADFPLASYPPGWLAHRLLPTGLAQGLLALLHTWGVGVAVFLHLRWRGLGARAALVGASAGLLSTFLTTWLAFPARIHALPWCALALWGADAAGRDGRVAAAALGGLALGVAALAGLLDQTVMIVFALAPLVVLARGPSLRRLLLGLLLVGVAALVAGAQAVPLGLLAGEGQRVSNPPARWFDLTARLSWRHLVLPLLPDALGSPLRSGGDLLVAGAGPYANLAGIRLHVGLPALALALAGIGRGTRGLALLAGLCAAAAFPTPVAWLAYYTIPGFAHSDPTRALVGLHLLAPLLVGHGFASLRAAPRRARRWSAATLVAVVALAAFASDVRGAAALLDEGVLARDPAGRAPSLVAARYLRPWSSGLDPDRALPAGLPGERLAGEGRAGWVLSPTLGPLLLALATFGAVVAATGGPRARRAGAAALAGLVALELLDRGLLWNVFARDPFPDVPAARRARELAGDGRVLADRGCHPGLLCGLGLRGVGGYHNLRPARAGLLLGTLSGERPGGHILTGRALSPAWRDALGVRVVVTGPGASPTVPDGLVRLPPVDPAGWTTLWENPTALPRARLHAASAVVSVADRAAALAALAAPGFDPRRHVVVEGGEPGGHPDPAAPPARPARLVEDAPERVVVEVEAPDGGLLVLADGLARGWSARTEAGGLPLVPADVALRGVRLPAGFSGRVTFSYARPGALGGWALTALGLALAVVLSGRGGSARSALLYFAPVRGTRAP